MSSEIKRQRWPEMYLEGKVCRNRFPSHDKNRLGTHMRKTWKYTTAYLRMCWTMSEYSMVSLYVLQFLIPCL